MLRDVPLGGRVRRAGLWLRLRLLRRRVRGVQRRRGRGRARATAAAPAGARRAHAAEGAAGVRAHHCGQRCVSGGVRAGRGAGRGLTLLVGVHGGSVRRVRRGRHRRAHVGRHQRAVGGRRQQPAQVHLVHACDRTRVSSAAPRDRPRPRRALTVQVVRVRGGRHVRVAQRRVRRVLRVLRVRRGGDAARTHGAEPAAHRLHVRLQRDAGFADSYERGDGANYFLVAAASDRVPAAPWRGFRSNNTGHIA